MAKPTTAPRAPKTMQQLNYEALIEISDGAHDGDPGRVLAAVAQLADYALRDIEPDLDLGELKTQLKEAQNAEPDVRSERRIASLQRKYDRQVDRRSNPTSSHFVGDPNADKPNALNAPKQTEAPKQ